MSAGRILVNVHESIKQILLIVILVHKQAPVRRHIQDRVIDGELRNMIDVHTGRC